MKIGRRWFHTQKRIIRLLIKGRFSYFVVLILTISMRTRFIASLIILWGINTANAQQMGLRLPADSTYSEIPFEVHNGLIVIEVIVNGKAKLNFILDSSIEHTILTSKTIGDDVGLNYLRKLKLGSGPDGDLFGYAANELNISLGYGVDSGDNHSMMVLESDFMGLGTIAETTVHGLIGRDVFGPFIVQPDYQEGVLVLHDPASFKVPSGYQGVPMQFDGGRPFIQVESIFENWDDLSESFQLKTGAPHTILYDSPNNIFHIPPKKIETVLGVSSGGKMIGYVGRIREIKIGEFAFESPIGSFTDQQERGQNRASIGMGLLNRFDFIIDFQGATLFLKPNRSFSDNFEYDMSGFKVDKVNGAYVVNFVQENSPAKRAGLQAEDRILSINDLELTEDNFETAYAIFKKRPNQKVNVLVERRGEQKTISFKLVRFL